MVALILLTTFTFRLYESVTKRIFNDLLTVSLDIGKLPRLQMEVQFSSVTQLCPTLCDHMDCSMPGFPVHHQLTELVQTYVHWVGDAIQASHHLLSPLIICRPLSSCLQSFPASASFLMSWLFASDGQILELQLQHNSFHEYLGLIGLISLQTKRLSRVFSNTTFQKDQFFSTQPSLWSTSHTHT